MACQRTSHPGARGRRAGIRVACAAAKVSTLILLAPAQVRPEGARVDDEPVLRAGWVRGSMGFGVARLAAGIAQGQTYSTMGAGLNWEGSVGCGYRLESGVRVGLRTDAPGRGLRADEMARGFDRETLGTGLSTVANPEGRLRWGAVTQGPWTAGLEYRVVVPTAADEDVTQVLGSWFSIHGHHFWRVDTTLDGIVISRHLAGGWVAQPAMGASASVWANFGPSLFVELLGTAHFFASTPYTTSYTSHVIGLSVGGRLAPCDAFLSMRSVDPAQTGPSRLGAGLTLECRFAFL